MHGATGLWHRQGVYYFRIRVPEDLQSFYDGKREIRFSLATKDKREAALKASVERSRLLHEFAKRRKERQQLLASKGVREIAAIRSVDPKVVEFVCGSYLRLALENDDHFRPILGPDWRTDFNPAAQDREVYPRLKQALANGETNWVRPILEGFLNTIGFELRCSDDDYRVLAHRFMQTMVKTYDYMFVRDEGGVVETDIVAPESSLPKSSVTLEDLFDQWAKAGARPPKTVQTFQRAITRFSAFIGAKNPDLITRKDVFAYRNYLLGGGGSQKPLSQKAARSQLDFLQAIFRRAVANEKISNNPFQDIPFDPLPVQRKPRVPFEPDDLEKIFASPIFSQGSCATKGGAKEAAYWLPILALYTGARQGELGQLRVIDVKKHTDLGWYIEITPEAGPLKTKSSERQVPLHSEVVRLGFIEYVQTIRTAGHERVFPFLNPDRFGDATGNWSKWFGRHLRALGVLDKRKVFHSFRHGFKQAARAAKVPEEIHDALTGHAGGKVGRTYGGDRYPLEPLFPEVERLRFPGVSIQKLDVWS